MTSFFDSLKTKHVALFLGLVYLVSGLFIYQDYGISYDEELQRVDNGRHNYNFVIGTDRESLRTGNEKYHGPAFEMLLYAMEKVFDFADVSQVYFMRHLVNFLVFFLSVVVMFFLGRGVFESDKWGLFAAMLYGLSPRFFAEAFYNSKDIIFLAFLTFSLYTLYRLIINTNWKWAVIHALVVALLIDIRILGMFMPVVTVAFIVYERLILKQRGKLDLKVIGAIVVYLALQLPAVVVFWPILWDGPLHHFSAALAEMSHYHWLGIIRYMGELYTETSLPWHYLPVWMALTIPVVFLALAFAGLATAVVKLFTFNRDVHREYKFDFLFLSLFLGPLLLIILMKSVVYDGWRHVYFLYAPIVLLATRGFILLWKALKPKIIQGYQNGFLAGLFALVFFGPVFNIIGYHPYEYVYFNTIGTTFFSPLEKNFEMDYWGLSYKQALEYILEKDSSATIQLWPESIPGYYNRVVIDPEERARIKYYDRYYEKGTYLIGLFRSTLSPELRMDAELVYELRKPSGHVYSIYKAKENVPYMNICHVHSNDFEGSEDYPLDENAVSGKRVEKIMPGHDFGYNARFYADSAFLQNAAAVRVQVKLKSDIANPDFVFVVSTGNDQTGKFWKGESPKPTITKANEWFEWDKVYDLSGANIELGQEVSAYLWSPNGKVIYQDDLKVTYFTHSGEFINLVK